MTLLIFLLLGMLIGFLRGGGASGLMLVRIKALWLLLVSFVVQVADIFWVPLLPQTVWLMPVIQALRFVPLLVFVALNIRDWRIWIVGLGAALNFLVIMLNHGKMPILWSVIDMPQLAGSVQRVLSGKVQDYFIMNGPGMAPLWWLGDILYTRYIDLGFVSVGDLVLGLGVLLFVQNSMARYSYGKHARGSLLPREYRFPAQLSAGQTAWEEPGEPADDSGGYGSWDEIESMEEETPMEVEPEITAEQEYVSEAAGVPALLPARLAEIAAMIPTHATVADIGSDHGKLAAYLARRGSPLVIATDISSGSLAKTIRLVKEQCLEGLVKARHCDGLSGLKPGEADVIVIAGMGGHTIRNILEKGREIAQGVQSLLLQPMNAPGAVRRWLLESGFTIEDETLAEDDGRIYQIICAIPGEYRGRPFSLFELEIGRLLVEKRHPLLRDMLQDKMTLIDDILTEISEKDTPKAEARRSELLSLRGKCEEVSEWLQLEK